MHSDQVCINFNHRIKPQRTWLIECHLEQPLRAKDEVWLSLEMPSRFMRRNTGPRCSQCHQHLATLADKTRHHLCLSSMQVTQQQTYHWRPAHLLKEPQLESQAPKKKSNVSSLSKLNSTKNANSFNRLLLTHYWERSHRHSWLQ